MTADHLVSIVVPVYRVEAFLHRCLESLLTQTHRNLEIILVDDGSPDRSGEICDDYAASDSRVSVIHQRNAGPSAARNAGLDRVSGEYVVFVDPDDWIHEDLVEHLLSLAIESHADLAICGFLRTVDSTVPDHIDLNSVTTLETDEALRRYAGPTTGQMTAPWAKLYATHLFAGIRYPEGRNDEDVFTTYKLVAAANRVALSERALYYYFVRPDSTTQVEQRVDQLLGRVMALREQAAFFEARGLSEVSGNCLKRSFLILRQLRPRVAASGDRLLLRDIKRDTKAVAQAIRRSPESQQIKAFAVAYSFWPQPIDATIWIYQRLSGRHQPSARRLQPTVGAPQVSPAFDETLAPGLEVMVVAYGSPDLLRAALEPLGDLPVTVVDNSSLPEIADLCAGLGCIYVDPGRNGGFGSGVNVGLAHRQVPGSDVLLLNPDAVIGLQDIRALQAGLRSHSDVASVGPLQVDESGNPVRVTWPFPSPGGTWLEALGLHRVRPTEGYVSGAILLLRSEALDQLGGFDEQYFLYAEEADWEYRAARAGWRHLVIDTVTAMHVGGGTSSDETRRMTHFHASHERFLRKHYGTLGWQAARFGQLLGDGARSVIRTGPVRDRLRARARLYLGGPMNRERQMMAKRAEQ
ncbi:MAG: glycosyltransferase [Microthrixaceae bacterium]|nr:glycosyltransferase [Microthrixaceae bacterium]